MAICIFERSLAKMKSRPQYFNIGETVLVKRINRGKGKSLGALWGYVANIAEVFPDKYLYQIKWKSNGPTLEDSPGTIAKRLYHQRSLKALPPGVSLDQLSSVPSNDDEYEVEGILGYKNVGVDKLFYVLWSGFPPSSATWEPR
jgi:hypothetical protein